MEINAIGTGFGLLGYLHDRDPVHLERIQKDEENFERFQTRYHELAETERDKALGVKVDQSYDEFRALAAELIKVEDDQDRKMGSLLNNLEKIDELLDEKIQAAITPDDPRAYEKLHAALEMEINTNGIAKGLGNFLRTHQEQYEARIHKDE